MLLHLLKKKMLLYLYRYGVIQIAEYMHIEV